jgi:hypothetical protein
MEVPGSGMLLEVAEVVGAAVEVEVQVEAAMRALFRRLPLRKRTTRRPK